MIPGLKKKKDFSKGNNLIILGNGIKDFSIVDLTKEEDLYVKKLLKNDERHIILNRFSHCIIFVVIKKKTTLEDLRDTGYKIYKYVSKHRYESIDMQCKKEYGIEALSLIEGITLSSYKFKKYQETDKKETYQLKKIHFINKTITQAQLNELSNLLEGVFLTRDLVNEPPNVLNATALSKSITKYAKETGYKATVLQKKQIESLKMGGLLAVNKGSFDPPTFSILEWKPEKAKNNKPYVIVGKGIVYDTGGLSLKSTLNSMDLMKSDMAGAAAVAGLFYALAKNKMPVHVIGLIPATDNRPSGNAYAPGDIITMYNRLNVEVTNSDAEGRMILADALSYGDQYNPLLTISIATLTGAASNMLGELGIVGMGNMNKKLMHKMVECGEKVHERVVELPFWDDYKAMIKSDIANLKNSGGKGAGAITAGKFLEHFTKSPFLHLDIAGPAFTTTTRSYRGKGGTGLGVRLLYEFLNSL